MKIAHIHLSDEFAGSEQYAASLASEQARQGHAVLVAVRAGSALPRWRAEAAPAQVVEIPRWVPAFCEPVVLRRLLKGFNPGILHTHLGRANIRGGKAAMALGVPWVATVHLRYKAKEMAKADGLVCIAGWQREEVWAENYTGKVAVVWNWLSATSGQPAATNLRKDLHLKPDAFVFGSVGRLHPQKGMDVLIKAFRKAFFDDENVALVITGRGPERLALQGLAGNDRRVVFAGYREEMPPVYATLNAYVSASRYEPFGLTILEAMAHKLPLVCTQTQGPAEFLQQEAQVHWVKPNDVEAMAQTLYDVYSAAPGPVAYNMEPFQAGRAVTEILDFYRSVQG